MGDDLVRGPGGTVESLRLAFLCRLRKGCAWSVSRVMSRETGRNDESVTGRTVWKRQGVSSDCACDGGHYQAASDLGQDVIVKKIPSKESSQED